MTIKAINARNQFQGTVKKIKRGDVVSEVEVDIGNGIITSIVSTGSVDDLGLKPGSHVIAIYRSRTGQLRASITSSVQPRRS